MPVGNYRSNYRRARASAYIAANTILRSKKKKKFMGKARRARSLMQYGSSGRPAIGFPRKQKIRMRYNVSFLLNPSNVTTVAYVFRANSIFDPDFSSVGHQPLGHDQWQQFYSTYVVIGSKITCSVLHDESAPKANAIVGVLLNDVSSLPTTTVTTLQEQGLGSWRNLQGIQNGKPVILSQAFSAKKFFDVANIKDNQDRIGASFGSDPPAAGDAYYIVWAAPTIPGGNPPSAIEVSVTIEYIVLVSDPVALPQS